MHLQVQTFSQKTAISESAAKKIIQFLYAKWMDATLLDRVIRRLRERIVNNELQDIVDSMDDRNLETVVSEVVMSVRKDELDHGLVERFSDGGEFDMRIFSDLSIKKKLKPWDVIDVQIMRTGRRDHQVYGDVKITKEVMQEVIQNFKEDKRGIKLFVDEDHEEKHKALAEFKDLYMQDNELRAKLELNEAGAEALNKGYYHYFSPEIRRNVPNNETGEVSSVMLVWGAFTNRPFFKAMKPIMASEWAATRQNQSDENPENYIFISKHHRPMSFKEIMSELAGKDTITKEEKQQLEQAFNELPEDQKKDRKLVTKYQFTMEKFSEDGENPEKTDGEGADGEGDGDDKGGEWEGEGEAGAGGEGGEGGEGSEGKGNDIVPSDPEKDAEGEEGKGDEPAPADNNDPKPEGSGEAGAPQKFKELKDGQVVIEASELKTMQATISKLVREKRQTELNERVGKMQFSEKAKPDSVVLPSMQKDIVEFAMSLSEPQCEKFLAIVNKFSDVRELFGEAGVSAKPWDQKKQQYSEEAHKQLTNKYMEEEKIPFKEASRKAMKHFDIQ